MSEMVNRIANIIHKYPYFTGHECEEIAKAIITAMRHPTIDMVEAGFNAHPNHYGTGVHMSTVCYRVMIDEALK